MPESCERRIHPRPVITSRKVAQFAERSSGTRRLIPGLATVALALLWPAPAAAQNYGPNILTTGDFSAVLATYVPWAGVDDKGNIHGNEGMQLAVDEDGTIHPMKFGPSVAVADLNGDGKPDLVLADSRGFFWFYPNSGTAQAPAFTQGEIMPVWLGEERINLGIEGYDNIVPRIQLVDLDNSKKLDIMAGTYAGKLFHVPNLGSASQPVFRPTYDRDSLLVNTRRKGVLWCNYMAPCMSAFAGPNVLDLIMGEGTYSANSIYWLHNTGSNGTPTFDEDHRTKIIPGMGLEQLTPAVVDWNNDGKPDIITGDRTGFVTLYLNNSTDPDNPTFAPGVHIKVAGRERFGLATTVAVGDLTGNHLPNLLIGSADGTVLYAPNTGKPGAPEFKTPATPIKGVFPPTFRYTMPTQWDKQGFFGAPDELIACVNPQLEPGFTFPEGEATKYALKFTVWPVKNNYFLERYTPKIEDYPREHAIRSRVGVTLKLNTKYRIHFWIKAENGATNFRTYLQAAVLHREGFNAQDIMTPFDAGSSWTEISQDIRINNEDDKSVKDWAFGFAFRFNGQGTFYIDDVQVQEQLP